MVDGKLANAEDVISSVKGINPSDSFVKELLRSGLPVVENQNIDKEYTELINQSGINLDNVLQEYMLAVDNADAVKIAKSTNEEWKTVRK